MHSTAFLLGDLVKQPKISLTKRNLPDVKGKEETLQSSLVDAPSPAKTLRTTPVFCHFETGSIPGFHPSWMCFESHQRKATWRHPNQRPLFWSIVMNPTCSLPLLKDWPQCFGSIRQQHEQENLFIACKLAIRKALMYILLSHPQMSNGVFKGWVL